jgi:hypothetical protein
METMAPLSSSSLSAAKAIKTIYSSLLEYDAASLMTNNLQMSQGISL